MASFDPARLREITERELTRFRAERPKTMAFLERSRRSMPNGVPMAWMGNFYPTGPLFVSRAEGAYLTDVDGHRYLDMNLSDTSMAAGYGLEAVAEVVAEQFRNGSQTLLPTPEAPDVTEELARRFLKPFWQFTLAAANANTEAMRIARAVTGRDKVLLFDGKYHGMLDETLHYLEDGKMVPEGAGLPRRAAEGTIIVQYNDLEAVETALSGGEVACVVVEPAVTNVGGIILPRPGFLEGLRDLTRRYGSLLVADEAHTHVCAYGGLTRAWRLESDILVLGKALGGGIPVGAYGLTEDLARQLESGPEDFVAWRQHVALGGTFYGNALQLAAVKATLDHALTEANHARAAELGARLADGIEAIAARQALPWSAYRLYCRSGYHFAPNLPRDNRDMAAAEDSALKVAIHVYLANRGIWEAIESASTAVSFAAKAEDIDLYLSVLEACVVELKG